MSKFKPLITDSDIREFRMYAHKVFEYIKVGDYILLENLFQPVNRICELMNELRFVDIRKAGEADLAKVKLIACLGEMWKLKTLHYFMDVPVEGHHLFKQSLTCLEWSEDFFRKTILKLQKCTKKGGELYA